MDLDELARRFDGLADALEPANLAPVLTRIGAQAKGDVRAVIRAELGDQDMSHFDRGNPRHIDTHFDDVGSDAQLLITPSRRAGPPLKVLQRRSAVWTRAVAAVRARTGKRAADEIHRLVTDNLGGS